MEPDREAERAEAGAPDGSRRPNRARIANQQFEDYELYVTIDEEELMMATMDNNPAEDKEDENVLAAVAHYIMVHYEEKEGRKRRKRSTSQNLGSTSWRQGLSDSGNAGKQL
jgi:hypothetical protein